MPKPLLITQRRRSKNPQIHPSPPPLLCCVSCRRPSTSRPQRCSSLSPLPRPGGSSSSWARASLPLLRDSRLRSCTRLWTWSTSTGALRTVSTVTTVTASTAPSRTGTEMTVCSRPCLRCSTMPAKWKSNRAVRRSKWKRLLVWELWNKVKRRRLRPGTGRGGGKKIQKKRELFLFCCSPQNAAYLTY